MAYFGIASTNQLRFGLLAVVPSFYVAAGADAETSLVVVNSLDKIPSFADAVDEDQLAPDLDAVCIHHNKQHQYWCCHPAAVDLERAVPWQHLQPGQIVEIC